MDFGLTTKTRDELLSLAKELEPYIGVLSKDVGAGKLRDAVEVGLIKRMKKLEQQADDDAQQERRDKLGAKGSRKSHPCPETVAIEASPKVYVRFLNMENPGQDGEAGADMRFFKGDKYQFHLFDGQRHVMPRCLVVSNPESDGKLVERMVEYWKALGYANANSAVKQAKGALRLMSLYHSCVSPRFEMQYNPRTDKTTPVLVGTTPRFQFTEVEPAPDDAEFGLCVKEIVHGENTPNEPA